MEEETELQKLDRKYAKEFAELDSLLDEANHLATSLLNQDLLQKEKSIKKLDQSSEITYLILIIVSSMIGLFIFIYCLIDKFNIFNI